MLSGRYRNLRNGRPVEKGEHAKYPPGSASDRLVSARISIHEGPTMNKNQEF